MRATLTLSSLIVLLELRGVAAKRRTPKRYSRSTARHANQPVEDDVPTRAAMGVAHRT